MYLLACGACGGIIETVILPYFVLFTGLTMSTLHYMKHKLTWRKRNEKRTCCKDC